MTSEERKANIERYAANMVEALDLLHETLDIAEPLSIDRVDQLGRSSLRRVREIRQQLSWLIIKILLGKAP